MQHTLLLCFGLLLWSTTAPCQTSTASAKKARDAETASSQPSVQKLFAAGKEALNRGDLVTAKRLFQAVRAQVNRHASVDYYLAQIRLAEKEGGAVKLEDRLAAINVASISLVDVTLEEAAGVVREQLEEAGNPGIPANIVLLVPPEIRTARFSLSLTDVPLTALLEYIAGLTGAEIEYEKHAVVFREPGAGDEEGEGENGRSVPSNPASGKP
ncbi:MAG TPA: hypothetical protein VMN36_14685 [Verrucomicrobiales bacterium]|nr:hypothetical protein [Verrucomicrobiales bacterium]